MRIRVKPARTAFFCCVMFPKFSHLGRNQHSVTRFLCGMSPYQSNGEQSIYWALEEDHAAASRSVEQLIALRDL
jgi:hypothetical protein